MEIKIIVNVNKLKNGNGIKSRLAKLLPKPLPPDIKIVSNVPLLSSLPTPPNGKTWIIVFDRLENGFILFAHKLI